MRTSASAFAILLLSSTAAADAQFSGRLDLVPFGEIHTKEGDINDITVDTEFGYGIGGVIEFGVARNVMIGFAPRYLFHVKGEPHRDGGSQLDLAARLKAHFPVSPRASLFGFLSPGYSKVYLPDGSIFAGLDPGGLILGLGGGADIMMTPTVYLTIELGYTFGFQSDSEGGAKYTYATSLMHLGFGVGKRF
ncbi:MAG TPA: outer membrane beta-barrel protein [Kofleriaceae bacterium]